MSPPRRVVLTIVLFVASFAIGRGLRGAVESVNPTEPMILAHQASDAPALQAPCPDVQVLRVAADELSHELGHLQAEILKGQLHDAKTRDLPVDWPPEAGELWHEASVEAQLEEALGESGRLLTLDCSEYPCMAVVMPLSKVATYDELTEQSARIRAASENAGLAYRATKFSIGLGDDAYLMFETLSFELPGHEISNERLRYRVDELQRSVQPVIDELLE